ncbi:unannotated protein [freshwater metagenome]|uniref:Unannotated protein n=1 Tax=freshwater metagenome TaxID=449393 RepID=A0A6J6DR77_9ZZZZ
MLLGVPSLTVKSMVPIRPARPSVVAPRTRMRAASITSTNRLAPTLGVTSVESSMSTRPSGFVAAVKTSTS